MVKDYLWRPLQDAMLNKMSTKELEKHIDIDRVHEQLMHILGEKHGVEYIDFPHLKDTIPNYGVYIEPDPDKNVVE